MKLTEILAGWLIFQLVVLGLTGGSLLNKYINCVPEEAMMVEAYEDSGLGVYLVSLGLPILHFLPETDLRSGVRGCPETAATSTPAI